MPDRKNTAWLIAIFCGFICLYLSVQNVGYFDASDSWNRYKMMQALVTTGSPWWTEFGQVEPQTCLQTIGPAVAALPFQAIGYAVHQTGLLHFPLQQVLVRATLLSTVFYTALWMCALAALCLRIGASRRRALFVCILAGTATLIFPYAKSAQAENLVGLGITIITLLIMRMPSSRRPCLIAAAIGLLYGFMLSCKPELALMFPLVLIAVLAAGGKLAPRALLANYQRGLSFCVAIIPGVLLLIWYNYARFGSISNSGNLGEVSGSSLLRSFSHPFAKGLYLQLLSPGKGIFWYCPILFATLPFLYTLLRRSPRVLLLPYLWWLIMTCVYAKFFVPTGDTALSSRFQVSYLAFGVLPLLAVPVDTGLRSVFAKYWVGFCAVISLLLQMLFCAVSFNIDYHRRLYSVHGIKAQMLLQYEAYYGIHQPLLFGFFQTAREGLLDLYFVRLNPLEGALTVMPGFWWLLAGTACAFAVAFWLSRPLNSVRSRKQNARHLLALQLPALCLATIGIMQLGSPGDSGLKLQITNPALAVHNTIVQDIDIHDMNDGREVYKVTRPFSLHWAGEIFCPAAGTYSFSTDSNQALKLQMAHQSASAAPGVATVDFVVLNEGWQPLELLCEDGTMHDRFIIQCRFPGEDAFHPLRTKKLKH